MFRYNTLEEAKNRAKDLDCEGACYPIATRNGQEGCNLWQHASLQFQPSTGVAYAIYHYMNLYDDHKFMQEYGLKMLIEISKFLLSRGQYSADNKVFGFYNVMGPDEFQMMVNHNTYTNYMAKKTFDYLLELINDDRYDVKKVLKQEAGSKMLLDVDKIYQMVKALVDISPIPVSCKIRAGWDHQSINCVEVAKAIEKITAETTINIDTTKSSLSESLDTTNQNIKLADVNTIIVNNNLMF